MSKTLEFPATIGPFTMQSADVAGAFNAFYRQHQFPKPDPESDENSMAGMDPSRAGISGNEMVFCQLSPLHRITLDGEAKAAANIPEAAVFFAWAYPVVLTSEHNSRGAQPTQRAFLDYGGYTYFNEQRDVVQTNCISPAPLGTPGLSFGRPQILTEKVCQTLTRQGRFQEITLDALAQKGATHFAWIRPGEFRDDIASNDGCFAYKFAGAPARYFPVVSNQVFTKDMLEEDLDENEAWVVLRDFRKNPEIEKVLVFDKSRSISENLEQNPNMSNNVSSSNNQSYGNEVADAFEGNDIHICLAKDSNGENTISYEEWMKLTDQGTVADPWIISVRGQLNSNFGNDVCER